MTDTQTPVTATELETLGLVAVIDRLHRTGSRDIPTPEVLRAVIDLRDKLAATTHVISQLVVSLDEYLVCDPHESDIAGEGEELALERHYWLNTAKERATEAVEQLAVLRHYFVRPTPPSQPPDTPSGAQPS